MNRGSGRRLVYRDDIDREIFLELLSELPQRHGVEVHCYCLMGNHFHLLVRSADARLSDAMQWLCSGFTRRVNGRRGVDGPVFRGRFHSVPVHHDRHATYLVRYIHANPLGLGWRKPLELYRWSSLGQYSGIVDARSWLDQSAVLSWFGDDREQLGRFVERARQSVTNGVLTPRHLNRHVDAKPSELLAEVTAAVALARNVSDDPPRFDSARLAVIAIAGDVLGVDRERVAEHFSIEPTSVRSAVSRARRRVVDDPSFSQMVRIAVPMVAGDVALGV